MREIKFRAYKHNRMDYEPEIPYSEQVDINEQLCGYEDNGYKLMQYTGLKDKNGIEIYEMDIVSLIDCEPSLYKIIWWNNSFKYGVEYIGKDKTNCKKESLEEFSSDLIEVVGNIYENPELLNTGE